MPSPSLPTNILADPQTVRDWLDARTEPSRKAIAWTPEADLYADYLEWAKAEGWPRECFFTAELFDEALSTEHRIECQRRQVQRGAKLAYEPCRALKMVAPIQAAA